MNVFKKRVIDLINKNNITQKILASEIGVTEATLSRNLNGVHAPRSEEVLKIANYFGVTSDYLMGNTDEPTNTIQIIDMTNAKDGVTKVQMDVLKKIEDLNEKDIEKIIDYIDYIKSKGDRN